MTQTPRNPAEINMDTEAQSDDELLDWSRHARRDTPPPRPGAPLPFVPWDSTERRQRALREFADHVQACRDAGEAELRRKDAEKAAEHAEELRRRRRDLRREYVSPPAARCACAVQPVKKSTFVVA